MLKVKGKVVYYIFLSHVLFKKSVIVIHSKPNV